MTRTDFERLAEAMKDSRPTDPADVGTIFPEVNARWQQWTTDCRILADLCATQNPRFDVARFLRACGINDSRI